jgi:hypothetical protein
LLRPLQLGADTALLLPAGAALPLQLRLQSRSQQKGPVAGRQRQHSTQTADALPRNRMKQVMHVVRRTIRSLQKCQTALTCTAVCSSVSVNNNDAASEQTTVKVRSTAGSSTGIQAVQEQSGYNKH